ncbi:hypothetical protein BHU72_07360 [Desulfuribacillus stibiiarsenatis]|uniref:Methyltransferase type 11 domain-containing protein n=1 Tax=Desulfuribacillus stibiiarsenatis TaxID=1390249 RepID=A0A1E5L4V7_9FIRM|nr:class I SAM-dependent methyltransferase [Desulfuribacillus stibiiarsenatis]OEH84999.1 hypothetical protein BHU72_07360 [Desulfuribacillus stibiiarsenatis]
MSAFDKVASNYDIWLEHAIGGFVYTVEKELLWHALQPTEGQTCLDLGCGTGIISMYFAEKGLQVTGIDISQAMIDVANSKILQYPHLSVKYQIADISLLPFDNDTFDYVIGNTVIEFVQNPKKVITEAMRVVKKGGRISIGCIQKESPWGLLYLDQGQNPDSIFSKAKFYTKTDIDFFYHKTPKYSYGLMLHPNELINMKDTDIHDLKEIELARSGKYPDSNAGFLVATWFKE